MMAAFLCATTTTMAAPVSVTTEEGYNTKTVQLEGHAPLETSASVISSDKEYRLRQGDELTIQVVQQADLGTRNGNDIMYESGKLSVFSLMLNKNNPPTRCALAKRFSYVSEASR